MPAGSSTGGQWTSGGGGGGNPMGGIIYQAPRGTHGTVLIPQRQTDQGRVIEEFPSRNRGEGPVLDGAPSRGRDNGRGGTPPFVLDRQPARAETTNPAASLDAVLANVLGHGIGTFVNALGEAFGTFQALVQDAFSAFDTQFPVPDPVLGVPDTVNIFIGGADDKEGDFGGNHPVLNSLALSKDVYGYNIYATHKDADKISASIQKLPSNVQVNVIGHSWGGDTAAQVALENPGRISALVTIDPVSQFSTTSNDYSTIRNSVGAWVDVRATGRPDSFLNLGNLTAFMGNRWGDDPKPHADLYIEAPYNHADFNAMMGYPFTGGRSIENILNRR